VRDLPLSGAPGPSWTLGNFLGSNRHAMRMKGATLEGSWRDKGALCTQDGMTRAEPQGSRPGGRFPVWRGLYRVRSLLGTRLERRNDVGALINQQEECLASLI